MENYNNPEIRILLCDYREGIKSWHHENVFNSCWYFYWNDSPGAVIKTGGIKHPAYHTKIHAFNRMSFFIV